jgi:hypothetical protein
MTTTGWIAAVGLGWIAAWLVIAVVVRLVKRVSKEKTDAG